MNGGPGADILRGGADGDTFVFTANAGRDTVADFEAGIDRIGLDALSFGIDSFVFDTDGRPDAAAPTFLYDLGLGQLSFDADGSGARAATAVAIFSSKPALGVADFLLI
jgi:Ca2+-binding RTX toxin-like protein